MPISRKTAAKMAKERAVTPKPPKPVKVPMQESIPLPPVEVLSVRTADALVSSLTNSLKLAKALRKLVKTEAAKIRKFRA